MSESGQKRACSCHCGAVRFTVELDGDPRPARCNCSICSMKSTTTIGVPLARLQVTQGEDELACYRFHSMEAKHYFCPHCGIHVFHQRRSDPGQYGVNVACIEGMSPFDFAETPVVEGIRHIKDHGGRMHRAGTLIYQPRED